MNSKYSLIVGQRYKGWIISDISDGIYTITCTRCSESYRIGRLRIRAKRCLECIRLTNSSIGKTFGRMTVVNEHKNNKGNRVCYCRCTCGAFKMVLYGHLSSGKIQSCGCYRKERVRESLRSTQYDWIIGKKFNFFTVLSRCCDKNNRYDVQCVCGTITNLRPYSIINGTTKSCGCKSHILRTNNRVRDLIGKTFGELTVVSFSGRGERNRRRWNCKCSCGKVVVRYEHAMKSGSSLSCGCLIGRHNALDLAGKTIGLLYIISESHRKGYNVYWNCQKSDTNEKRVFTSAQIMRQETAVQRTILSVKSTINTALKNRGSTKTVHAEILLGCTLDEIFHRIGERPTPKHDLDHICPVSQVVTETEVILLQHYTNLRWLTKKENIKKSNKWTPEGEEMCRKLLGREWIHSPRSNRMGETVSAE